MKSIYLFNSLLMQNKETVIAVSERIGLSPRETGMTFFCLVINVCSDFEKPPSGPIRIAHLYLQSFKEKIGIRL